jgi:hypothetical protein
LQELRQAGVLKEYLKNYKKSGDFVAVKDQELLLLKIST